MKWDDDAIRKLHAHPDWTAAQIAEWMGTTTSSVSNARQKFGRFGTVADRLCVVCDARPVWIESPKARRLHLCKGCFLDEVERRMAEEDRSAALRQREHRRKS